MVVPFHIAVAMKPVEGTFAGNAMEHGVAGLSIDECRIACDWLAERGETWLRSGNQETEDEQWPGPTLKRESTCADRVSDKGRWPANIIHDGSEEVVGQFPRAGGEDKRGQCRGARPGGFGNVGHDKGDDEPNAAVYDDSGSAARFFQMVVNDTNQEVQG